VQPVSRARERAPSIKSAPPPRDERNTARRTSAAPAVSATRIAAPEASARTTAPVSSTRAVAPVSATRPAAPVSSTRPAAPVSTTRTAALASATARKRVAQAGAANATIAAAAAAAAASSAAKLKKDSVDDYIVVGPGPMLRQDLMDAMLSHDGGVGRSCTLPVGLCSTLLISPYVELHLLIGCMSHEAMR